MLQWDLSNTPLAQKDTSGKVPTEGELFALTVGLLMLEAVTYDALRQREIVFHEENLGRLVEVFEYRLPELEREFATSALLRQRLSEFVGIRMTRSVCGDRLQAQGNPEVPGSFGRADQ